MAFASPTDMINRYDPRILRDLVSDTDTRVSEASLETDEKIIAALESAAGEIIAACFKGKRYSFADLSGLTGPSAAYLADINCRIAFWLLWQRKPWSDKYEQSLQKAEKASNQALEMLRSGQDVFDVEEVKQAGVPEVRVVDTIEVQRYNLVVDAARGSFYPARRVSR